MPFGSLPVFDILRRLIEDSAFLPEAPPKMPQIRAFFVALNGCMSRSLAFVDSMSQVGKLQDKFLSWKFSQVIFDQSTALKYEFPMTRPNYLYSPVVNMTSLLQQNRTKPSHGATVYRRGDLPEKVSTS